MLKQIDKIISGFLTIPDDIDPSLRYDIMKRNILGLMLIVTVVPVIILAILNYHQYQSTLKSEIFSPTKVVCY